MYAKEITMYVDWVKGLCSDIDGNQKLIKRIGKILTNLRSGIEYCASIATQDVVGGENLPSLKQVCDQAMSELSELEAKLS
jgi:hypothetical protein